MREYDIKNAIPPDEYLRLWLSLVSLSAFTLLEGGNAMLAILYGTVLINVRVITNKTLLILIVFTSIKCSYEFILVS
ncbi:hypothetical protein SRDD_05220 [Serratia sp. DD3]|nr:hypothetical protein SRDD_05220 [Serratia sp. DD3]